MVNRLTSPLRSIKQKRIRSISVSELGNKPIMFFISFIVIFFFGVVVIESTFDVAVELDRTNNSNSQNILINNGSSQVLEGTITSLTATRHNQSWLEFDGVNDYVQVNNQTKIITDNLTVSLWFIGINASQEYTSPTLPHLFWRQDDCPGIMLESDRQIRFQMKNQTGASFPSIVSISNNFTDNEWINVIGTYNSSSLNMTLYVDGIAQSSRTDATISDECVDNIRINNDDGSRFFKGGLDEIRVYNQTLSSVEVLEIFNSGRTSNSSLPSEGLVLWYSFNEGTGATVFDKSGNGNNGI